MKESEIRDRGALNKYLSLVKKDTNAFFDAGRFVSTECPACGSGDHTHEFKKSPFSYVSCKKCRTLFVNPRPPFCAVRKFYSESQSASFWINEFFKPTVRARRKKIFVPRAAYVSEMIRLNENSVIGDIGAGFGIFLEELRKVLPGNDYVAIEPSGEMADICAQKKLRVVRGFLEELEGMDGTFDLLTTFELIEHLCDPESFLKKVYSLLKPGGSFYLTTLNGLGFDILLLWEKSKSTEPPHHLNFFNTASIRRLLKKLGFEIVEVSTPGRLDWDIVEGMIKHENVNPGRFWRLFAAEGSSECKDALQNWISAGNMSSHMRILARKPRKKG
ncbi:MAG: class I SAM-dependent methyltransferase [Omnitrophica bacterium]|nr:class I SAM-dependent methyltransferase [Candidatus Omnitrophota bacterium]